MSLSKRNDSLGGNHTEFDISGITQPTRRGNSPFPGSAGSEGSTCSMGRRPETKLKLDDRKQYGGGGALQ
jgi:hypothetical protein